MIAPRERSRLHAFRIASLVVPSAIAWRVALSAAHPSELTVAVTFALAPLWVLLAGGLVMRAIDAIAQRRRGNAGSILAHIDVLTAAGSSLAWLSAFAIAMSVWLGWASLAVVGLLGTGLLHLVVLVTFVAVRGDDPIRRATVSRRFVPDVVSEGDVVIEELRLSGTRIPMGFRLFAAACVGPRWARSHYAIDATAAGGEIVLESEVGPAFRGEHAADPVELWLQDTFGLCRSVRQFAGAAHLTVLPKPLPTSGAKPLLLEGPGPREPETTTRLPTEGSLRLREYQTGDDVRRIHWVRSQAARQLIVRLPDEAPPDRPHVRLVLDTCFVRADKFECDAPSELLDALVCVWLAVGRALVEEGARVTLVTAAPNDAGFAPVRRDLSTRDPASTLRLGARVRWQDALPLDALLTDESAIVVSRGVQYVQRGHGEVRWIVVPATRACTEVPWWFPSPLLPFPMGSLENRGARRKLANQRSELARRDYATFMAMSAGRPPIAGSFIAVPNRGAIHLEAMA